MFKLDCSNLSPFLPADWLDSRADALAHARALLETGSGAGGNFTGCL